MPCIFYSLLFFQLFISPVCFSQNHFSIGVKGGMGLSISSAKPSFTTAGGKESIRTNAFYAGGLLGQYLLANKFGIESGILVSYQSFREKRIASSFRNYLGRNSFIGINDYQVPIQLVYKINHRYNPAKYFKVLAGASLDWISPEYFEKTHTIIFTSNLLGGIRVGRQLGKYGRLECGLEYQYSAWGSYKLMIQEELNSGLLDTRCSVLSLNVYYYFLNKEL